MEPKLKTIPILRQCALLGLVRASFYYKPAGESEYNLHLMRLIDSQYIKTPFYGVGKVTKCMRLAGHLVNPKRVRRLMRKMGLMAVYPKPKTTQKGEDGEKKHPYRLRNLVIYRPNQVWSTDITYIPVIGGYVYLCAIIDWFSRYVLSWELSNTQDVFFCLDTLEKALAYAKPEIFNSDQGSQFTSKAFTERLESADISISWDGRGRVFDNIFVERLWRSVKYEEVYIKDYHSVKEAFDGLSGYFSFYNTQRIHQSLDYQTPKTVHFQ